MIFKTVYWPKKQSVKNYVSISNGMNKLNEKPNTQGAVVSELTRTLRRHQ